MAELEDLKMWLWNNEEGPHVTVVTNYNKPWEKRSFFSFAGENTRQGFKAYRDKQPTALKDYFQQRRKDLEIARQQALQAGYTVSISKLVENTGHNGRRVLRGCMLLMMKPKDYRFLAYLGEEQHCGEFSPDLLSGKQLNMSNAVGAYFWRLNTEEDDDYGEAF